MCCRTCLYPRSLILVKERSDFFVAFSSANSFYTLEVIGALEGMCLDNALCDNGADSRNILKFR